METKMCPPTAAGRDEIALVTGGSPGRAAAMTAALAEVKASFRCPALYGSGAGRRLAEFTLLVEKVRVDGADHLRAVIEVASFWHPAQAHGDDVLRTGCLAAPPGSLVARMACDVRAVPDAATRIESMLRAKVAACPCNTAAESPAPHVARLPAAIDDAAGRPLAGGLPPPGPGSGR